MRRPKTKTTDPDKRRHPGVRTKIYVRDDMIGSGKVDLLRMIDETGSISGAAAKMGCGYRRAWFLLDTLQRCFKEPLTVTSRGGPGGTKLTPLGKEFLDRHDAHEREITAVSAPYLAWLERQQS